MNVTKFSCLIVALVLVSDPILAAKIKDARCADLSALSSRVTPNYLAVVDGFYQAGKSVVEEIDFGEITSDAAKIKATCARYDSVPVASVRHDVKTANAGTPPAVTMNPKTAKCRDFTALSEEIQPLAVYWVAGREKVGGVKNEEVDEEFLARPIAQLVSVCKASPRASFYEKTKKWLRKRI